MPYALGNPTVNKGFLKNEVHKLNQAFVVATGQTFYSGMPVVLSATGEAVPAAAGADRIDVIGFALFGATAGETVTVVMKAYAIIFAEAAAALDPSTAVKFGGFNGTTKFNIVSDTTVTVANYIGKSLKVAAAGGDIVEVALF
tara:strand:- start:260 stop:688 length:429 start_codon:yes stop_codon:yes gene_type:complete